MKFSLDDLDPKESQFQLSAFKDITFTLKPFSLRAQIFLKQRFGEEAIQGMFTHQKMPELSEVIFFLLKDKSVITTLEDLQESILTQKDRVAVMTALFETIGLSQPVLEKLTATEDAVGNEQSPSQPIGALSST